MTRVKNKLFLNYLLIFPVSSSGRFRVETIYIPNYVKQLYLLHCMTIGCHT